MQNIDQPREPWRSFFSDLDAQLTDNIQLHCCGGFALTQLYGVSRTTNDVDFLAVVPNVMSQIIDLAGHGTPLHKKHGVYLQAVTVLTQTDSYEDRLVPMFPGAWVHLALFGLEAHDLALSKLERNNERDRNDVQQLARAGHLKAEILCERYRSEMRPYLSNETRHDSTLRLWLDAYFDSVQGHSTTRS